jgi:hypothetical protein
LDPNAWFILILLTYPQSFNPGAFRWWIPAWLPLRLYWHLGIQFIAPAALFLLGLLFPRRSRLDTRRPWLKWLVIALTAGSIVAAFVSEYNAWYDISLLPHRNSIDRFLNPVFVWSSLFYVGGYWVLLLDNLRTASLLDARRRLRVLLAGSVVGLGSILIIFGFTIFSGANTLTAVLSNRQCWRQLWRTVRQSSPGTCFSSSSLCSSPRGIGASI